MAGLLFINIVSFKGISLLFFNIHLLLFLLLFWKTELFRHEMSVDFGLLHYKLKPLFLKNGLSFFFLAATELLFIFFPFSLKVCDLFITLLPEGHHILRKLLGSQLWFFLKPLSLYSLFADLFEAVLALLLVIVFLICLELLILAVCFGQILFDNIKPVLSDIASFIFLSNFNTSLRIWLGFVSLFCDLL